MTDRTPHFTTIDNRWYLSRRTSDGREIRSLSTYADHEHAERDASILNKGMSVWGIRDAYRVQGYRVHP